MRTVFPSEKRVRGELRKLKKLRRREKRLGFNISSNIDIRGDKL